MRHRSALPFGGGAETFDVFYIGQYNKIILFLLLCRSQWFDLVLNFECDTFVLKPRIMETLLNNLWQEQNLHYVKCIREG